MTATDCPVETGVEIRIENGPSKWDIFITGLVERRLVFLNITFAKDDLSVRIQVSVIITGIKVVKYREIVESMECEPNEIAACPCNSENQFPLLDWARNKLHYPFTVNRFPFDHIEEGTVKLLAP